MNIEEPIKRIRQLAKHMAGFADECQRNAETAALQCMMGAEAFDRNREAFVSAGRAMGYKHCTEELNDMATKLDNAVHMEEELTPKEPAPEWMPVTVQPDMQKHEIFTLVRVSGLSRPAVAVYQYSNCKWSLSPDPAKDQCLKDELITAWLAIPKVGVRPLPRGICERRPESKEAGE